MFLLESPLGPFTIGAGFFPWSLGGKDYLNINDPKAARETHLIGYLKYSGGTFETELGGFCFAVHEGPKSQQTVMNRRLYPPREIEVSEGWL
jgi:hypothetical protein